MINIIDVTPHSIIVTFTSNNQSIKMKIIDDYANNDILKRLNNNPYELSVNNDGMSVVITDANILSDLRVLLVSFFFVIDFDKKML